MSLDTSAQKVFDAITARLQVVSDGRIKKKLQEGRKVAGYWGTAPTGRPHFGYMVPLVKVAECVAAGCDVTIYLGDSYAYLVNYDVSQDVVAHRTQYYRFLIGSILRAIGVDMSKITFVAESIYTSTPPFCKDLARMLVHSSQEDIKMVGLEVTTAHMMSPLLCPVYQALSEVYIGGDFQLGGEDQLGMFAYADKVLPRIGYEPVSHLANVIVPGLHKGKMSSSALAATKIEWLDSPDTIKEKLEGISWAELDGPAATAVLPMLQHCLFPLYHLGALGSEKITAQLVDGSTKEYTTYEELERDLQARHLGLETLQPTIVALINQVLSPIRAEHATNQEWRLAEKLAYND
ncbi:Nucleotidylyl transferase [Aspergillus pseudotamarii]|uniref:tyrosine--tRNA ligase n=1 Tax=Aspergillus pseudotamarii TaxID=132259 RepID=A0A5N6SRN6_ASPPS|nr:Nucleotidylyl transferase [Aspergillus pseudotamarii]KAE8137245.1 Nucleotidylyl transferase [Aspergillus pseudotamarii]